MFASFPLLDTNLSHVLKYIQSILLPVKCCRLKLIVRANHLYSPLAWDWKKCDPVTLAATVFFCRGKENILVCKAVLPCNILALSLSYVSAILDCFHLQYKFLCYDGLKAGNFPSVMETGQGWECLEEPLVCSSRCHG